MILYWPPTNNDNYANNIAITTARHIGLNHFRYASDDTSSSTIESFRFCNLDKIQEAPRERERITFLLQARSGDLNTMRSCPGQCRAGSINYL